MTIFKIVRKLGARYYQKVLLIFLVGVCIIGLNSCQDKLATITNIDLGSGEKIIVLGDSITAGFGLQLEQAYPYLLSQKLGLPIVNRGVSGDRTADGLARLSEDILSENPWLVIVGLGGNDFLKKVPKSETEQNLRDIIGLIQAEKAITVILGMNLGLFSDEYQELYQRVAEETGSYLIPQILKGIIDNPKHRQSDIIHPNVIGQELLAEKIAKGLEPLLKEAKIPLNLQRI